MQDLERENADLRAKLAALETPPHDVEVVTLAWKKYFPDMRGYWSASSNRIVTRDGEYVPLAAYNFLNEKLSEKTRQCLKIAELSDEQEQQLAAERQRRESAEADAKNKGAALEFARAAVDDAIYLEDGLDGSTGEAVIKGIDFALNGVSLFDPPGDEAVSKVLEKIEYGHKLEIENRHKEIDKLRKECSELYEDRKCLEAALAAAHAESQAKDADCASMRHKLELQFIVHEDHAKWECHLCGSKALSKEGLEAFHQHWCILAQKNPGAAILDQLAALKAELSEVSKSHSTYGEMTRQLCEVLGHGDAGGAFGDHLVDAAKTLKENLHATAIEHKRMEEALREIARDDADQCDWEEVVEAYSEIKDIARKALESASQ